MVTFHPGVMIPADEGIFFRPMRIGDISSLVEIEKISDSSLWSEEMFRREMEIPFSVSLVGESGGIPVSFGVVWVVQDTAQLIEIAVSPAFRRQGLGRALVSRLTELSKERGCKKMELEFREGNLPAQAFYERMGFKRVGIRKDFYGHGQKNEKPCNAILMQCELS